MLQGRAEFLRRELAPLIKTSCASLGSPEPYDVIAGTVQAGHTA